MPREFFGDFRIWIGPFVFVAKATDAVQRQPQHALSNVFAAWADNGNGIHHSFG